jgi:cytoskeletal protein RodZ
MEPRPGSVGDSLRRARIARGLSLQDVESSLHVRPHYVQALETDDFAMLPPTVYTRALIRDYARLVGLDPVDLLERSVPMRPQDRNPIRPAISPIDKPPLISWKPIAIGVGVLLCVGLFLYLNSQLNSFADSMDTAQARAQPLPTPLSRSISALLTPLPTPAPGPTETPEPSPTPVTGLLVEARITERSWVQVWSDGKSILAQTLTPGATRAFNADQSVRMRVGNAGGIDITVNGVHQGRLGSTGQVLDASWGRD